MATEQIRLGIVGAAGRGKRFQRSVAAVDGLVLHSLCDLNRQAIEVQAKEWGVPRFFDDYQAMLDSGEVDAVVIGTPMPLHVPQAIAALRRDVSVLSEVPAGVSVAECRELVQVAAASRGTYMMAENYTYTKPNQVVRELVRQGLFGEVYYAEGEYLHELKELNEITKWRRKWQTGIDGITYGTHSLGPILQWFAPDRVTEVCCAGSGHHYRDPRGDAYQQQDTTVMLARTQKGRLIKIRVDMLSDRPHAMTNYQLQGTDGAYESARASGEINRIWLRCRSPRPQQWEDLAGLMEQYTPAMWRQYAAAASKAGHGGGDLLELVDFAAAIRGERPCPIGIHEAMGMTLPGLVSQQSIAEGGRWLAVPDSRTWVKA